eukprot:7194517-Alexandrium_andersonii.AAC.1
MRLLRRPSFPRLPLALRTAPLRQAPTSHSPSPGSSGRAAPSSLGPAQLPVCATAGRGPTRTTRPRPSQPSRTGTRTSSPG